MFLFCQGTTTSGGGGGGTTIINNYNYTTSGLLNRANFDVNYNPHYVLTSSSPIIHGAGNISMASAGTITFTFNEVVVFKQTTVSAIGDSMTLYKNGTPTVVNFVATTYTADILCDTIVYTLSAGIAIEDLQFLSQRTIERKYFTDTAGTEIISNLWCAGAISTGTSLQPNPTIKIYFYEPTIIYGAKTTGDITLYNGPNLVYIGPADGYPNVCTYAELSTELFYIDIYCPAQIPTIETTTFNFLSYPIGYSSYESYQFTCVGTRGAGGYTGTISFNAPTYITAMQFSASATIQIDGNTYTTGTFTRTFKAQTLTVQNLENITYEIIPHIEQTNNHTYYTETFSQLWAGSINIITDDLEIYTADQLNTPAMIDSGVIISADANAAIPFAGAGTMTIQFRRPTYLNNITFSGTATIAIGSKTYICTGITYFQDFINASEYLCDSFTITTTGGKLLSITYYTAPATIPETRIETFGTTGFIIGRTTREFATTNFDTATAGPQYITPGTGIYNTTYLGGATLGTITFDQPRYVNYILCINSQLSDQINTTYIGNFGVNSVIKLFIKKTVAQLTITGAVAIAEIEYEAPQYTIFGLPDNAPTLYATAYTTGQYTLNIQPLTGSYAYTYLIASKSTNGGATIYIQTSTNTLYNEEVYAQWSGTNLELYHGILRTGGTGAILYYSF